MTLHWPAGASSVNRESIEIKARARCRRLRMSSVHPQSPDPEPHHPSSKRACRPATLHVCNVHRPITPCSPLGCPDACPKVKVQIDRHICARSGRPRFICARMRWKSCRTMMPLRRYSPLGRRPHPHPRRRTRQRGHPRLAGQRGFLMSMRDEQRGRTLRERPPHRQYHRSRSAPRREPRSRYLPLRPSPPQVPTVGRVARPFTTPLDPLFLPALANPTFSPISASIASTR